MQKHAHLSEIEGPSFSPAGVDFKWMGSSLCLCRGGLGIQKAGSEGWERRQWEILRQEHERSNSRQEGQKGRGVKPGYKFSDNPTPGIKYGANKLGPGGVGSAMWSCWLKTSSMITWSLGCSKWPRDYLTSGGNNCTVGRAFTENSTDDWWGWA